MHRLLLDVRERGVEPKWEDTYKKRCGLETAWPGSVQYPRCHYALAGLGVRCSSRFLLGSLGRHNDRGHRKGMAGSKLPDFGISCYHRQAGRRASQDHSSNVPW